MFKTKVKSASEFLKIKLPRDLVGKELEIIVKEVNQTVEDKEDFIKFLENAPVMTDEQYAEFKQFRKNWC